MTMVERAFVPHNAAARARLEALAARLTEADFQRPIGPDWTVTAALAHLLFWERRALILLDDWHGGWVTSSSIDPEVVNRAALPEWALLPGQTVIERLITVMAEVDRRLEALDDATIAAILTTHSTIAVDRSAHRHEHLEQVERALM
jgi:hypothetical protein